MIWPAYSPVTLTLHPRTALWWQQRGQCHSCAHCSHRPLADNLKTGKRSGLGTVCAEGVGSGALKNQSCMTMRDEGGLCGPDALLFKERT